jgi:hypothetical protein
MIDNVEIEILETHNRIGINFSGGADSAMIMYLTCLLIEQNDLYHKTIVPLTGIELNRPFNADAAEDILKIIKETFPRVKFAKHELFEYSVSKNIHGPMRSKIKAEAHQKVERSLFHSNKIDVIYAGVSRNPPWKNLPEDHVLRQSREKNRDSDDGDLKKWRKNTGILRQDGLHLNYHTPLYNHTKKKVAELYNKYSLINSIFPLTNSCIGQAEDTKFFTTPCKLCWWCAEKYWAFEMYDGAIK